VKIRVSSLLSFGGCFVFFVAALPSVAVVPRWVSSVAPVFCRIELEEGCMVRPAI